MVFVYFTKPQGYIEIFGRNMEDSSVHYKLGVYLGTLVIATKKSTLTIEDQRYQGFGHSINYWKIKLRSEC